MDHYPTGTAESARRPWDQMSGEPDRWYGRFQFYLGLGPLRTVTEAARRAGLEQRNKPYQHSCRWVDAAHTWYWRERAHAWDVEQRNLLALSERHMRLALRNRRVAVIEDKLEDVCAALDTANLAEADQEQARSWLGELRRFLHDLLELERKEFEGRDYERDDTRNAASITADDLRAAQRAMEQGEWRAQRQTELEPPVRSEAATAHASRPRPDADLLVCTDGGSGPGVALPIWQEVRGACALQFSRVLDTTLLKFTKTMRRARGLGRPLKFVHMALPATAEGVQFIDRLGGGDRLSKALAGVQVLVLARYEGEEEPGWARDVPCVVRVLAGGDDGAPAAFTRAFWSAVGGGSAPDAAPDAALDAALACAPGLRGCVRVRG